VHRPGSLLGTRVLRAEDPRFLTGGDRYIDNLEIDGALHVVYVRSSVAHARFTVDLDGARHAPGIVAVYAAPDVDLPPDQLPNPRVPEVMAQPAVAIDTVRFVGEIVAIVVGSSRAAAVDAAEAVVVDYEPLPVVVDPEVALTEGTPLLFPEAGTNVAIEAGFRRGDDFFDGCDVVVRQRIVNQRLAPCPLEVRSSAARPETDGRLTVWSCTQGPHGTRRALARRLGLEPDRLHVVTPDVGGGFGAKGGAAPEEVLLPWLALRLGRPVRWTETRTESMQTLVHGRGQIQYAELGGTRDGRMLAYRLRILQDAGAYPTNGAMLPFLTRLMAPGVYDLANVDVAIASVATNTCPVEAYRGAGRPEATAAIERIVDVYAAEIGHDPAEVRSANLLAPDAFPHVTPTKAHYDSGDYGVALERVMESAGYAALREEQRARRSRGDRRVLGVGLSVYVEITNGGGEGDYGSVEVTHDGGAIVRTGTSAHGQGHDTVFAMLAHDETGIPFDRIEVRHGDTDDVPRGNGTGGSRSLQAGGPPIVASAQEVARVGQAVAAELLEANPLDMVLDLERGEFHVAGTPSRAVTWADVARRYATDEGRALLVERDVEPEGATFPFGAHVAVVEIDLDTGHVELVRHVALDDCGRVMNPLIVTGQVHGGVAQGAAQALWEEVRFDADGNPLTATLLDYAFPSAAEFPSFERVVMETPTARNALGAKGIGEAGTIGATPAVQNAVVDALAHLGVRHVDMPCTPERVWRAIGAAGLPAG
jgi:carbon-monoxide dehydrogenase large subunit